MILKFQDHRSSSDSMQQREPLATAIEMLFRAYRFAMETRMDPWQYALEIEEFRLSGVSISELRLLVFTGMVLHGQELTNLKGEARRFNLLSHKSIPTGTCFVLSPQGAHSIRHHAKNGQVSLSTFLEVIRLDQTPVFVLNQTHRHLAVPTWNASKRELLFNRVLVKKFKASAPNQETILNAFQEENWAVQIDDPLPPVRSQDSRRRLNDTIKSLNRHQPHPLIAFRGDGSGKGVLWEHRNST